MPIGEVASAKREPKHYDIMYSLDALRHTRKHIRELFDDIVGAVECKKEPGQIAPPIAPESLVYVLDNVSSLIKEECSSIRGITDDIRSAIL